MWGPPGGIKNRLPLWTGEGNNSYRAQVATADRHLRICTLQYGLPTLGKDVCPKSTPSARESPPENPFSGKALDAQKPK